jgi:hypothetical protein
MLFTAREKSAYKAQHIKTEQVMNCSTRTHTIACKKTATNKSSQSIGSVIRCSLGINMKIRPDGLISDTKRNSTADGIGNILPIAEEHSPSI